MNPSVKINLFASRVRQRDGTLVRDYTNHLHPFGLGRADANQNALPHRRLPMESLFARMSSMITRLRPGKLSSSAKNRPASKRMRMVSK